MFGKVFCLYLVLHLFMIIVSFYAWLSGTNFNNLKAWREFALGIPCLFNCAILFHFCNYAHHFTNIVRHQKTLYIYIYIYIYGAFLLCCRLECK